MFAFKHVIGNTSESFEKLIVATVNEWALINYKLKSVDYHYGDASRGQAFTALLVFEYELPKRSVSKDHFISKKF